MPVRPGNALVSTWRSLAHACREAEQSSRVIRSHAHDNKAFGACWRWSTARNVTRCGVAQDVYRRLSAGAALGGLLRVRLSPELRVARAYGPLAADERCSVPIQLATLGLCSAGLVPGSPPRHRCLGPWMPRLDMHKF